MEQNQPDSLLELQVDQESKTYFREASRWSNFIAIIYFIGFGFFMLMLLIVGGVFLSGGFDQFPQEGEFMGAESNITVGVQTVQVTIVFVYLIYGGIMLYRFSGRCRRAIENQDQLSFTTALRSLRNYFIAGGIIAIVGIIADVLNIANVLS